MGHLPLDATASAPRRARVLTLFGTHQEAVKLAPIVRHLRKRGDRFQAITVSTGQGDVHGPYAGPFRLDADHALDVRHDGQTPNGVFARVLSTLEPVLANDRPDVVLVQGDTSSAAAGALAAFHASIPVGHVEAGLRSGNSLSPFPEEMNRRMLARLATLHFAATSQNLERLVADGVPEEQIFVTGNPVVEALSSIPLPDVERIPACLREALSKTEGSRRLVVSSHHRENFGGRMADHFKVLRNFVQRHSDVSLIFPVDPSPRVEELARHLLWGHERIHLIEPLGYFEFLVLFSHAWLIASDSSGVQAEAPSLGKPLLILRESTERPESIESGMARLIADPAELASELDEAYAGDGWASRVGALPNPFGDAESARRIVDTLERCLLEGCSSPMAMAVS